MVKTWSANKDAVGLWDYNSVEAFHLPASTRAASRLYYRFQQSILAMKTLTEVDLLPAFNSRTCSSLRHFSFNGTFAGLPCRPRLPNPAETAQAVFEYISHLGGSRTLHSPVKLITNPVSYLLGPLSERTISERHQLYQKIVVGRWKRNKRRSSEHAG